MHLLNPHLFDEGNYTLKSGVIVFRWRSSVSYCVHHLDPNQCSNPAPSQFNMRDANLARAIPYSGGKLLCYKLEEQRSWSYKAGVALLLTPLQAQSRE